MTQNTIRLKKKCRSEGFTLLEMLTVVVIIAILAALLFPVYIGMRQRAAKVACMTNLKGLYVAASSYVQSSGGVWPQVDNSTMKDNYPKFASDWIEILRPYNIAEKNWICPTIQELSHGPDIYKYENRRLDYVPMPFDATPGTSSRWSRHPWFVEKGDVHGNGNLVIYTNGTIDEIGNLIPK